ncbi:hypothetical protein [Devosia sp.]|uniref:hypothetical protein n=1 Tax=Devosia sp. TaxID=1871048 RepID=UPI003A8FD9D6
MSQKVAHGDMRITNLPSRLWQNPVPHLCLEPWHGTTPFTGTGDALRNAQRCRDTAARETMQFGMDLRWR